MKLGFIGLGKMGYNMVTRLMKDNHEVVVWDPQKETVNKIASEGAIASNSPQDMISKLPEKKVIWLMVPNGKPVDENLEAVLPHLSKEDIVIDGGNSYWRDSQARGEKAAEKGVRFIDCGTSGGVWGLENGYCLMYGGSKEATDYVEPVFKTLAPQDGYVYCGPTGTGHMVKEVHNGIEYGLMQAYAEGFEILKNSPYDLNLEKIAGAWRYGSVIRSWLLELAYDALGKDPNLDKLEPFVQDSGEGRWTLLTAMDFNTPVPVIATSLFARFQSRDKESFGMKLLAALRNEFGGHAVKSKE
ncbi:MAG: decarboxylating 6-phosphogluconate dehydrogenase [Bacteroidales bacterium]|nr:decarboxylating 6-phosphogluconate dehydrogenase [Bacteroidales bacterium]